MAYDCSINGHHPTMNGKRGFCIYCDAEYGDPSEIDRLRAELNQAIYESDKARADRDRAEMEAERLRAELAEARESASRYHAELVESLRKVADERDEARRERDARPKISRIDADFLVMELEVREVPADLVNGAERAYEALRAHAAGSGDGGDDV